MRILIGSYTFSPAVGGIESVSLVLARAWREAGHQVTVVTCTPGTGPDDAGLAVVRSPCRRHLVRLVAGADVYWQNGISLRLGWPTLFTRTPLVITVQTWLGHEPAANHLSVRLKRLFLRRSHPVAISRAIAAHLGVPAAVIGNPYDEVLFGDGTPDPDVAEDACRSGDILFVGRLVSDKGVDLLIHALARLAAAGSPRRATIVGDGPERPALEALALSLGLGGSVVFRGGLQGAALSACYRDHAVLAVPSRWEEPLGVVALEGIAGGCAVVGSDRGGLPEAIGTCGLTFPSGSVAGLAAALEATSKAGLRTHLRGGGAAHLSRFRSGAVSGAYLGLFRTVCGRP